MGTEPGLSRGVEALGRGPKLSRSAQRAEPAPVQGAGARVGIRLLFGWSFDFPVPPALASVAYLSLGAEPAGSGHPVNGLGSEGVTCPSFWSVSVTGRVHSASLRVASCAWNGPQLVGGGREAGQGRPLPQVAPAGPGASPGVDK